MTLYHGRNLHHHNLYSNVKINIIINLFNQVISEKKRESCTHF